MAMTTEHNILKVIEEEGPSTLEQIQKYLHNYGTYIPIALRGMVRNGTVTKIGNTYVKGDETTIIQQLMKDRNRPTSIPVVTQLGSTGSFFSYNYNKHRDEFNEDQLAKMLEDCSEGVKLYMFVLALVGLIEKDPSVEANEEWAANFIKSVKVAYNIQQGVSS